MLCNSKLGKRIDLTSVNAKFISERCNIVIYSFESRRSTTNGSKKRFVLHRAAHLVAAGDSKRCLGFVYHLAARVPKVSTTPLQYYQYLCFSLNKTLVEIELI